MSDPLSDTFRANVRRVQDQRGLSIWQLGKVVTPHDPSQVRVQIVERAGRYSVTLATVGKYAAALDVPVSVLLEPGDRLERTG